MANKPTQPVFPLGLVAEEQSTLAGVLNTGTIEHGPDAVLTLPEGNASAGLPSSVRYNADSDEFEGFYENGGWLPLGGGGIRWEVLPHASTATLTEGRGYLINNTTGASTVVLPSPTRIGESVTICDAYGKFATYPLTVSPSGNNLYGSTEDMAITTDNVSATFTWSGPEQGWIITSGVGLGQGRVYSREIFTKILASETSSVALNTPPTIVDVYADGKRLAESKYSLDGNVITFSPSLPASTELQVIEYTPIQLGTGGGSGSSTITWVYNGGSAIGGETEITLDVVVDDVPAIDINGSRQYKNLGFTFDPLTSKITLAQELEPEDEVVVIINGTPNIYNQIDHTLREVARVTNVKDTEVVYFSVGAALSGYKVIYDKETQRAYPLPADIVPGTTAVSLSSSAILVHSAGSVDLGELAVSREEYVTLSGSFDTGVTVNTKNELVVFTDGKYRWDGVLPKEVSAGSTPEASGGIGDGKWVGVGDASLRSNIKSPDGFKYIGWAGSVAELSTLTGASTGDRVLVKSYYSGGTVGGGIFEYDASKAAVNDGAIVFNGWVRKPINGVYSTHDAGIVGDGSDVISVATSRLNAIASAMTDGGTLNVHGVITVNTHIVFSNAKSIKIVGCGSGSGKAIIQGDKASWYFKGQSEGGINHRGVLHLDNCPDHVISDLEILGVQSVKFDSGDPQNDADAGISGAYNDGATITRCRIHRVGAWGVFYLESSDVTVTKNTIYDCSRQSGVNVTSSALKTYTSARCKITYNRIYDCGLYGVEAESQGPIEQLQVDNNIISGCTRGIAVVQRQPSTTNTSVFCTDNIIVSCADAYATSYANAAASDFRVTGGAIRRCATGFVMAGGIYDIKGVEIDGTGFNGIVQHSAYDSVLQIVDSSSFYAPADSTVHTGDIYIGLNGTKYTVSSITNVNVSGWVTTTYLKKVTLSTAFNPSDVYEGARFKQPTASNPTVCNGIYMAQNSASITFRGRLQNCSIRNVTHAFAGRMINAPASQHFFEYNQIHSCDYYIFNEASENTSWYFANNSIDGDTAKNVLFNCGTMIAAYQIRPSGSVVVRSKTAGTGLGANYFSVSSGSRRYYQINVRFYGAAYSSSTSSNLVIRVNGNALQAVTATSSTFANDAVISWYVSNGVLTAGTNYLDIITSVSDFSYKSYEVEFLYL